MTPTIQAYEVDRHVYDNQFGFQNRFSIGRVLNVGCDNDGAQLGIRQGAVNLDLHRVSKITGQVNPVNVMGDARELPFSGAFDTVVLGEILEHMTDRDAVKCLEEAREALRQGTRPGASRVVVTMPHDKRERERQGYGELRYFADGIPVHHPRFVGRPELLDWVETAGLKVTLVAEIRYVWGQQGTGLVAVKG